MEYFYAVGTEQHGPCSLDELVKRGIDRQTLVWHEGMAEWKPAETLPELASLFNFSAPPAGTQLAQSMGYATPTPGAGPNGLAVAAMVLGIVSLVGTFCYGLGVLPGILAIIFSVIARKRIDAEGGEGRAMATAGLICGIISVSLVVVLVTAVFGLLIFSGH
jgi:hypothetical protein